MKKTDSLNLQRLLVAAIIGLFLSFVFPSASIAQDPGIAPGPGPSMGGGAAPSAPSASPSLPTGMGGGADEDTIPGRIGLSPGYMGSGIGAGYLATILGTETAERSTFDISGTATSTGDVFSSGGRENDIFKNLMIHGAFLGVAMTSLLILFQGLLMFFNKLEYGDIMGEAKERFVGMFRGIVAFGLVMPLAAGGISGIQHAVGFAGMASNGIGNKAAEVAMSGGFGAPSSPLGIFAAGGERDENMTAEVFSEMVGQHSCLNYMKAINASPMETANTCQSFVTAPSGGAAGATVPSTPGALAASSDEEACDTKSGMFAYIFGSVSGAEAYTKNACLNIREDQRDAYERVEQLYEDYGDDMQSDAAIAEMREIADEYDERVQSRIETLTDGMYSAGGGGAAGGGGTYMENEMQSFVATAGWPGLGFIYTQVGSQIDGISAIQASGGSEATGFNIDLLKQAGRNANSATRIIQRDATIAGSVANDVASGNSASTIETGMGAGSYGLIGLALGNWGEKLSDLAYGAAESINESGQDIVNLLVGPIFEQPAPAATYTVGSRVLGAFLIGGVAIGGAQIAANVASSASPIGKAVTLGKKISDVTSKITGGTSKDGNIFSGNLLANILVMYISALLMLMLLVASFLVLVLPKLPIFFVSFLAMEWAIWVAIVVFASPLWIALNLTTVNQQPGLFTQRALSGLGVLLYIMLFPALVVVGVIISALAYNMIVPIVTLLVMMSFGGGIVESIIGFFAMPFMVMLAMMISAFVAVSAITRVPSMITNFLGIQPPGGQVSESFSAFMASPNSFNNTANPQMALSNAGRQISQGAKSPAKG